MNLEIQITELRGSRLVTDLQDGAESLAPFYFGSPRAEAAYRRKAEEAERRFQPDRRRRMAAALRPTSPRAAERLERIAAGDGFFVTTGQQPGLFTGPLYTIYKALSAARLARELEERLDCTVAPLFWVASEDHDWEEASHASLLDARNELHTLTLPSDPDSPPASMHRRRLGEGVDSTLSALAELLPDTEFTPALLEQVRTAYRPERSVADAFADLLAAWLEPFDVLLADATNPVVKELSREVLRGELASGAEHERRIAEQTAKLEAAGYAPQVGLIAGASNVFYEDEQGRERLLRTGDGWELRRTQRTLSDGELWRLFDEAPERFSPNVLLRPVAESAVFPTLAYVGGPAEASYFAQIGCLFRAHGVEMPVVVPRHSGLLVESKVRKVLDKFSLEPDEFRHPVHEVAARVLREELPDEVKDALGGLGRSVEDGYERLLDAARGIDPTLERPLKAARVNSLREIAESEKKISQHLKQRNSTAVDQIGKAAANLYPGGKPQERVLNAAQYLARYGPGLLGAIYDAMEVELTARAPAWAGVSCG